MDPDRPQAEETPAQEPEAPQMEAPESQAQVEEDPLAGLRSEFQALGQDITPENAASKVADMRRGMYEAQESAAESRRQAEELAARVQELEGKFQQQSGADYTYQRDYRLPQARQEQQQAQQQPQQNYDVIRLQRQLNQIESENKMSALRQEFPQDVTPQMESFIRLRMQETNVRDPRYHFMALMGERKITEAQKRASEKASQSAALRDAKRNSTDMPSSSQTSQPGSSHEAETVEGLTGEELAKKQLDIVQRHMKG